MAYDAEGYTIVEPSVGSRLVYVSQSTGSDSNDGLTTSTPKQTFASAMLLIRPAQPDWLLLKCGDTWSENLNYKGYGASGSERSVITSYGSGARPIIKNSRLKNMEVNSGNCCILGIDMYASFNDPDSADYGLGTSVEVAIQNISNANQNILIEDCVIRFYSSACHLRRKVGHATGMVFRRNIVTNSLKFGVLPNSLDGGIIEENVFDKCGWDARTNKLHSIYAHDCIGDTVFRNNILSRSGNYGVKCSTDTEDSFLDFEISDNFFYKSAIGLDHSGGATGYDPTVGYSHQRGQILNNVFYKTGKTITPTTTSTATYGVICPNSNDMLYQGNCWIFNDDYYGSGQIIGFGAYEGHGTVTITDERVYKWNSGKYDQFGSYLTNTETVSNLVQTNSYLQYPAEIAYADPERSLASYSVYLGGANTDEAWLTRAKEQRKGNYDVDYTADAINDYFRAGLAAETPSPSTITPLISLAQVGGVITATVSLLSRNEDDLECKIDWPAGFTTLEYSLNSGGTWATYTDASYLSFDSSVDDRTTVLFRATVSTFTGPEDLTVIARAESLGLGNTESATIVLTLTETSPSGFQYIAIVAGGQYLVIQTEVIE